MKLFFNLTLFCYVYNEYLTFTTLRVYSYESKDLRETKMIDLSGFEGEIYVFFKGFGDDIEIDLQINFVKVCVGSE